MDKKYPQHICSMVSILLLLLLLGSGSSSPAAAAIFDVQVSNFQFSPATVTIQPGDTVRWVWINGAHSTTSGSACTPDGSWDSGVQSAPFEFSVTFFEPGAFPYYCIPHCAQGMVGTVVVSSQVSTVNLWYSPTAVHFGNVIAGTSADQLITVMNDPASTAPLTGTIANPSVPYSVVSGGGPFTLAPGELLSIVIRFSPVSEGAIPGVLEITNHNATNITGPIAISLMGLSISRDPIPEGSLFYPHVASGNSWETEVAVINTSTVQPLNGTLRAYDANGLPVSDPIPVSLLPNGRMELTVGTQFSNPEAISYLVLETDSSDAKGYTKFYQTGVYRVAIPATDHINSAVIPLAHIASDANWWTGLALVNTTTVTKNLVITFDNGTVKNVPLYPYQHTSFTIESLFDGTPQPDLHSGSIAGADGVIGLELFGNDTQLSGVPLTDERDSTLFYPHVASDQDWWTGVVAYNPSNTGMNIVITPYQDDGTALAPLSVTLDPQGRFFGESAGLGLPAGTAWFKIEAASGDLTGFELFGTRNGAQLAGFSSVGNDDQARVFAKIEKSGWTGVAFVNTEDRPVDVALIAYDDSGVWIGFAPLQLAGHQKIVGIVESLFPGQDISAATYVGYFATGNVVGFQLNGSADGTMLDGLPGM